MLLVDSRTGSKELLPHIRKLGEEAELAQLDAGDMCFYGNTPEGQVLVGIERKRMDSSDLLASIHTGRFSGFQQHNMIDMYPIRIMIVEGLWKASEEGHLLVRDWKGWRPVECKGRPTMYSSVFNWLASVHFTAGTFWVRSSSPFETALQAVCLYKWFSKDWDEHNSQGAIPQFAFPQFTPPTLIQKVAAQLEGVGVRKSLAASKHFESVADMVKADEREWMKAIGAGAKTARKIVQQIHNIGMSDG